MQLTEYLHIREGYLGEHVFLALVGLLNTAGYEDERVRQVVTEAFAEGQREFEGAQADRITDAIARMCLPDPDGR